MSSTLGVSGNDLTWAVIDGAEGVRQQVAQALLLWLGEWFRDTGQGSNIRSLLGAGDASAIAESIEATVLAVDTVTAVRVVNLAENARTLSGLLEVSTSAGETVQVAL